MIVVGVTSAARASYLAPAAAATTTTTTTPAAAAIDPSTITVVPVPVPVRVPIELADVSQAVVELAGDVFDRTRLVGT